jgi:hypothetical protein
MSVKVEIRFLSFKAYFLKVKSDHFSTNKFVCMNCDSVNPEPRLFFVQFREVDGLAIAH